MRHILLLAAALATPAVAQEVAPARLAQLKALMAGPKFVAARAKLDADYDRVIEDVVKLTEIPAPPFGEKARGEAYLAMLRAHGLADVEMDEVGNVMGLRRGTGKGPLLVVAAHLDTVFPGDTNVKVRREGDRLHAPGIGDDTCSLSALLAFVRAMDAAKIATTGDILFVGNVGEEGPGDLRGVRHLFTAGKYKGRIAQFISFEPGRNRVTDGGVGSLRYRIAFKGPGGHSLGDFGIVNPAYPLAEVMTRFGQMQVPDRPRTVFNVGVIAGGTSVNSIPFEMGMEVDMRSESAAELKKEEAYLLALPGPAADRENAARSTRRGKVTAEAKKIGDRPVGATPRTAEIVQVAAAAVAAGGGTPSFGPSSTDSNLPMSLGIPAVTLGSGFSTERAHSLDESLKLDRAETVRHMAIGLATVVALAGGSTR